MIVTIDDACTACGLCCDTCPEVYRMGEEIAEVFDSEVPEEHQALAEQAAEECPVGAIQVDT